MRVRGDEGHVGEGRRSGEGGRDEHHEACVPAPDAVRRAAAAAFLDESRWLSAAADRPGLAAAEARVLRHRAVAWRTTAGRIPAVPEAKWPDWLLQHLAACAGLPEVGPEYVRQGAVLLAYVADTGAP
jgi:hypothetical protein